MLASRKQLYLLGLFSPAFLTLLYYTRYERSGGKILWVPNFDGTVRDILWASPDPNDPIPLYWRDWIERVPVFTMATAILTTLSSSPWTVDPTWNAANNSVELLGAGGNGAQGTTGSSSSGGGGGSGSPYMKLTNGSITGTVPFRIGVGGEGGIAVGTVWEGTDATNSYSVGSGANASGTSGGSGSGVNGAPNGTPAVVFTVSINRTGGSVGASSGSNRGGGGGGGSSGPAGIGGDAGSTVTGNGGSGGGCANNGTTGNGGASSGTSVGGDGGLGSSGAGGTGGTTTGNNGSGDSGGEGSDGIA